MRNRQQVLKALNVDEAVYCKNLTMMTTSITS
jgi:hypothetical protein